MNEVEIVITGTNRAGKAFKEAQRDAKQLERSLDDTGKTAKKSLGDDLDDAGKKAAKSIKDVDHEADALGGSIERSGAKAKKTFSEVEHDTKDLALGLKGEAAHFSLFDGLATKAKKAVNDLVNNVGEGATDAAKLFEKTFLDGLGGLISNPEVAAVAVGLGALLAVPLVAAVGTALGAAVTLGLGAGVIAAGIVKAAKDSRVSTAWGDMFAAAGKRLETSAGVFVEPLLRAARNVGSAFDDWQSHIDHAFQTLAPLLDDLSVGFGGFLDEMGPGFDELMDSAAPFFKILADELPNLGEAFGSFFESIAAGSPGIQEFFGDLLNFVENSIEDIGILVEVGSRFYEVIYGLGQILSGDVADGFQSMVYAFEDGETRASKFHNTTIDVNTALGLLHGKLKGTASGTIVAAEQFDVLSRAITQTALTSDILAGQMTDKIINTMLASDHAALGFQESLTKLNESIATNGRSIDLTTAKGQANREAILSVVEANVRQYDSNILVGMSAAQAATAYDQNTAALERQLHKAGLTQAQIDGLIGKYRGVPANVDTDIALHGLTDAINGLIDLLRRLNGLDGTSVDAYVNTIYRSYTDSAPSAIGGKHITRAAFNAHGGITGAAGGGARGGMTWVGEQGPELVRLPYGSTVIPNGQSESMASAAAAAAGPVRTATVRFTGNTDGAFATAFMKLVRIGAIEIAVS